VPGIQVKSFIEKTSPIGGVFLLCATHDASLDGASPLWGLAVANH